MEKINVNGILYDSVVDGPGLRSVIFLQGCPHKCVGCHNADSWGFEEKNLYAIEDLIEDIKSKTSKRKITISGGEPFSQKVQLLELVKKLKESNFHICIYTGYLYDQLLQNDISEEIIQNIDMLIDGKFEIDNKDLSNSYRGSLNQKIMYLENGKIIGYAE